MNQHNEDLLDLDSLLNTAPVKCRKSGRVRTAVVFAAALVLLTAGFLLGFRGAVWQETAEPTPPPRVVELDPPESVMVAENDLAACYVYLEPLTEKPYKDDYAFYDGITYYIRGNYPEEFGGISTDRFNFWLRIELSETGKAAFNAEDKPLIYSGNSPLTVDWEDTYLGTTPYFDPDTGEMNGWFVYGWLDRSTRITIPVNDTHLLASFYASPVVCETNISLYSTDALVDVMLHDDNFWRSYGSSEPEELTQYFPLLALSRREDCVPILIDCLLSAPYTEQTRALIMLNDYSSIRQLMTDEQRWQVINLLEDYFTVTIYDYALTEYHAPSPLGHTSGTTYFQDKENRYPVSSEVPEALQENVNINFCARVELTAYHKTQYTTNWILHAENENPGADPQHKATLGAREYYDENGEVAGWFVYGHVPIQTNIEFWLDGNTPGNMADYSLALRVTPGVSTVITVDSGIFPYL